MDIQFSNGNLSFKSQIGAESILRRRSKNQLIFDLRSDNDQKDGHLRILLRLDLPLFSDQDPKIIWQETQRKDFDLYLMGSSLTEKVAPNIQDLSDIKTILNFL